MRAPGSRYQLRAGHVERAVYVIEGNVEPDRQTGSFRTGELIVFKPGAEIIRSTERGARLMLIGGEPSPEKRHIHWNFVSSRADRIEQAKDDWRQRRFALSPERPNSSPCLTSPARPVPWKAPI